MIIKRTNKGLLKFTDAPLVRMTSFQQTTPNKLEAGGVLLGRYIRASKNIIVDRVSIPMIGDQRDRHRFVRGEKRHQQVITTAWKRSNHTCNYLGEWHTHPESYPTPSQQDIKNWKELLQTRTFSSLYLYFVIVGTKKLTVWEGNRRTNKIIRLQ